jgi:hypothetical protein
MGLIYQKLVNYYFDPLQNFSSLLIPHSLVQVCEKLNSIYLLIILFCE